MEPKNTGRQQRNVITSNCHIVAGYEFMHLTMGYDGNKEKKVYDAGFERANVIIDRCAILMPGTAPATAMTAAPC